MFRSIVLSIFVYSLLALSVFASELLPSDFALPYEFRNVSISPDGKKFAITVFRGGKNQLLILSTKTFKPVGGFKFEGKQGIGESHWVNDERLVFEVVVHKPWLEEPVSYGELMAINFDGSKAKRIYGYQAGEMQTGTRLKKNESIYGWGKIINLLPDDDKHVLISSTPMSAGQERLPTVYKINVYSGKMSRPIIKSPIPYSTFITDQDGAIKFVSGVDKNNHNIGYIFNKEKRDWVKVDSAILGTSFHPLSVNEKGSRLYLTTSQGQDKVGLFSFNLNSQELKSVYTDPDVDITSIGLNVDRTQAYSIRVDADYPAYMLFKEASEEAKVFKNLLGAFPGYTVDITSKSQDSNYWVIYASNDVTPGAYYLFDKKANGLRPLFPNLKKLNAKLMSQAEPIKFKASDGTDVNGYLTYPKHVKKGKKVPLVTLVHGGPRARDYWEFNREVQMLAAQGYAVLRVNYRGSSGYGTRLLNAGNKQWGGKVQQDIIEGTEWAIEQGRIDASKVCIMGFSFGGYSAMMSATLAPDLFKCVIAGGGVYDLNMMFEEGDIPTLLFGKAYLLETLGSDEILRSEFSPINRLAKLKAPVLVVHGEKDNRVPIEQAEALIKQLKKHNKQYHTFIKDMESHGFYNSQNRAEYYQEVADFLSQHLR